MVILYVMHSAPSNDVCQVLGAVTIRDQTYEEWPQGPAGSREIEAHWE